MPYIKQSRRDELDKHLVNLFEENLTVGELNYIISSIIKNILTKSGSVTYSLCNSIIGVLECAKLEFYRKVLSDYEDLKISENGGLY